MKSPTVVATSGPVRFWAETVWNYFGPGTFDILYWAGNVSGRSRPGIPNRTGPQAHEVR
jgi:hypothetical protein